MRIIKDKIEKRNYRITQEQLFGDLQEEPDELKKLNYTHYEYFAFGDIDYSDFFELLKEKFSHTYPEFCIATSEVEDPIFVFNLIVENSNDYVDLMRNTEGKIFLNEIGLRCGLSNMYGKIFFFHVEKMWCIYANQYYDKIILAY
ncbi:MAG: hypothetical protein U0V74_16640 [Chitinophagales bacterium]